MESNNEISVNKETFFCDIQHAFSSYYPFLKIDFFLNITGIDINKKKAIDPTTSISKFLSNHPVVTINFNSDKTVSEVSDDIKNRLNVIVQVLRKSGNIWLPISLTENWTLENQNAAGELLA